MKIAYILVDTRQQSGSAKSFMTLLKGVMKHGVRPLVIVPDKQGCYHDLLAMSVEVIVLDYRPSVYPWLREPVDYLKFIPRLFGRILVNMKATRALTSCLRNHGVDIVHTNVSVIDIGFRAARKLGIPHVYHIREYGDKNFYMHFYPTMGRFLKYLRWEKCYSVCITKGIQAHYNQQGCDRSRVIYNGIFPAGPQKPCHKNGGYFLFAGRVEAVKGIDMLLNGYIGYARRCEGSPLPLHIAGEVTDKCLRQTIETEARKNGLESKIHFLGPRNDIGELMSNANAVVITSPYEAFGRCMPEAMFLGSLTIARASGGTTEQLENGLEYTNEKIALEFEIADQLSMQLMKAANMPDKEYEHITQKAWETVNRLYSKEKYVDSILTLYRDITHNTIIR